MEIIKIHYTPSMNVTNWLAIEPQAKAMAEFIDGKDYGHYKSGMFALHHSQVCEKPFNFFVLNPEPIPDHITDLGSRYIVNPKILSYLKESVTSIPEGCVSFPHRAQRNVPRAMLVIVEYEIPDLKMANGLRKVKKEVSRIIAQIFQHECEHGLGKNIMFKGPKS